MAVKTGTHDFEALVGYSGAANPHLYSSPNWYAHELGAYFLRTGRTAPYNVRIGRGYHVHANDMLFLFSGGPSNTTIERVK